MLATEQKTGTLAVGAIIAAVLSFVLTFAGHPAFGFFSALISIPLGIIGLVVAASPRVGGGGESSLFPVLRGKRRLSPRYLPW